MLWPKKNSYKEFDNEKNSCGLKISLPPITFLMVSPFPTFWLVLTDCENQPSSKGTRPQRVWKLRTSKNREETREGKKWKIALQPTFSFFPTKEAGPRLLKRQNKNIFRFALSKYAQMVISKTCKMMSLLIVNQKRTELKTWRDSPCSMRAYSHHFWPLGVIIYF